MKPNLTLMTLTLLMLCLFSNYVSADPVAFPGAEGSGMYSTGGRGGDVYEVTNLNNSGTGSIVDAVSSGNRTIVFRVSGTIELGDTLLRPKSNTTIAGQTAPGDGICIKGRIYIGSVSDVIIRYIRVRVDDGAANSSGDAIDIASGSNIIIDHVSASYGRDETISCQDGSDNVTVQWCILSEALTYEGHSYGALVRGEYGEEKSYHHNLFAHNNNRNPRPGNYTSTDDDPEGLHFDFRNNVMYNWDGSQPGYNADSDTTSRYNFVGNVAIVGPESGNTGWIFKENCPDCYAYWEGNAFGENYSSIYVPTDQWDLVRFNGPTEAEITAYKARSYEIPMNSVTTTSASQALDDVLNESGCSYPARDIIDTRIVNDVTAGTGSSISTTANQPEGAWPTLTSGTAPTDTDHDGMPDTWEIANGLDETDDADRNYYDFSTDYTNLEVYLNSLLSDDIDAPAYPTALYADADNAVVNLDWDDNTEADLAGYHVYRSTTSGTSYSQINTSTLTVSEYTDNTAVNGTTYFYVVTAIDTSSNESEDSDEAFATPIDPDFYGDTNDDLYVDMTDLPDFIEVWLESDCLTVSGWDIDDDCKVNNIEFALFASNWMLDRIDPATPLNLSASSDETSVSLDWDDNTDSDLQGYNIYRSTDSGTNYVLLNTSVIVLSEYTDSNVVAGTTYYYVVTAVDTSSNESDISDEAAATPGVLNTEITIEENQTGLCSYDGDEIENEHTGFSGDGYINTENSSGAGIDYSIEILAAGTYTFTWQYANGSSERSCRLLVDDTEVDSDIDFPATSGWDDWSQVSTQITLTTGIKDVRLEATQSGGCANIDYMHVAGPGIEATACP